MDTLSRELFEEWDGHGDYSKFLIGKIAKYRTALENLVVIVDDNHPQWPGEHNIDTVLAETYSVLGK